jgi:tetraacyldisaccharide 4'-kinase
MHAPKFWHQPVGLWARLLSPLGALYAHATRKRVARAPKLVASVPVICVGNINAGGTGKTPSVIALVMLLTERGYSPHVVTRGYCGKITGPTEVNIARHKASDTGDEPLIIAPFAPVWIAKNRAAGVEAAIAAGADVIVMDDGHQNPDVKKDVSIIVVDALLGFGNGKCIPAGPLREPIEAGLARADVVLSIGDVETQEVFATTNPVAIPHVTATLKPLETGMDWSDGRYFAFAGIGYPEKFFRTLRGLGANLVGTQGLEDHQSLSSALLSRLERDAAQLNAQLVTTEKDAARLPPAWRHKVLSLPVRLAWNNQDTLEDALEAKLGPPPLPRL